jgi:HlyD family secretion protein
MQSLPGPSAPDYDRSIRMISRLGLVASALFLGTVGLWATTTEMTGAVIAPGQFVVVNNSKKVQHQNGGVIAQLFVREGSRVKEGDMLLRLDDTQLLANLQIIRNQLDEATMRRARLIAEREGAARVEMPLAFAERFSHPDTINMIKSEQRLFETRLAAREGQKAQLRNRRGQLQEEIVGLNAQLTSRRRQLELIGPELQGIRELFNKKLVPLARVNALERDAAAISGQVGQLGASIAQAEGRIAEIELQIIQIDEELRNEASRELREVDARLLESIERQTAAADQLRRTDIRAPSAGVVHQLAVHTAGGVLGAGEVAMLIVPENEQLELESRVTPQDVDQMNVGQEALVRLMAFNQRTTPELKGVVRRIGADVTRDPGTNAPYFSIRIALDPGEGERLAGLRLISGMQADAFVKTESRTPLSYLMRPLRDQLGRAFRER